LITKINKQNTGNDINLFVTAEIVTAGLMTAYEKCPTIYGK
jgi:hypothetical protein